MIEKLARALFVPRADDSHRIARGEIAEHLRHTRDDQELVPALAPVAGYPVYQTGDFVIYAEPIRKAKQRIAGRFQPHDQTPRQTLGAEIALQLSHEEIVRVAERPVHIKAQPKNARGVKRHVP
jgi:hypothetical protein